MKKPVVEKDKIINFWALFIVMLAPAVLIIIEFCAKKMINFSGWAYIIAFLIFVGLIIWPLARFEKLQKPRIFNKNNAKLRIAVYFFALFLIWACISTIFATDIKLALFDIYPRGEGLLMFFMYAAIFCGAMAIDKTNQRRFLLLAFLVSATVICLIEIIDYFTLNINLKYFSEMTNAPFANSNHQGYFLTMQILLSAGIICFYDFKFEKYLSLINLFLTIFLLCLNNTFGCQLAVIFSLVVLTIFALIKDKKILNKIILIWLIIIATIFLATTVQIKFVKTDRNFYNNLKTFFGDVSAVKGGGEAAGNAGSGRWSLWMECLKNIREHPLVGIGLNCQIIVNPSLSASRPHNELLQFASTMGLPSLIFYLGGLIVLIIEFVKKLKIIKPWVFGVFFAAFGYFVSSFFGVSIPYTFVYYVIFLGLLISGLMDANLKNAEI